MVAEASVAPEQWAFTEGACSSSRFSFDKGSRKCDLPSKTQILLDFFVTLKD
jgi:hypothetical protein